jgi:post-segregation antitoxin (ccd killing protein)
VRVPLPDDLYRAAREQGLSISTLAQRALEQALREQATNRWIDSVRARPPRVTTVLDTTAALDGAREEFGA